MSINLLHTPEGVRDIYGKEYAKKQKVSDQIHRILESYGYRFIQTPSFEFFDIFNKERGSVASREMFKFFDREGNTLVLRPDITPSIARCAAKYYMFEDMPLRLCYEGNIFVNNHSYRGSLKEFTVAGAEMINDMTSDADAEILAVLIESLRASGLKEFQVEIGLADYFNGLMDDAKLDRNEQDALRDLIEQKNYFGVEELLEEKKLEPSLKDAILSMPKLFGGFEQLEKARELTNNERALSALDHLKKLYGILSVYGLESYVSFDLGMLGKYQYYTGIIFKAYTYGSGTPIATGGRYDKLLSQFGKNAPATGFGIYLDELLTALSRQKVEIRDEYTQSAILYDRKQKETAIRIANILRGKSEKICMMKKFYEKTVEDYLDYAKRAELSVVYYLDEKGSELKIYDIAGGSESVVPVKDFTEER